MFGLIAQAKAVKRRATSLVQLNVELAKLEGKQKATALGIAAGLGLLAAVLVLYAVGFLFAAAAAGLAEALPLWLSLLIVMVVILLLAALSGWLAMRFARKASPPTPSQAIEEAERTAQVIQSRV
jgi:H+/Cl- antiporter ClcA